MKKLLSIIVSVCMLLTLVAVPVNVFAAETEVAYEDTTLGTYYKFTFGEDEIYDYTFGAAETYKENTFYPLWATGTTGNKVGYKAVTDVATGEVYDTLEIVNGSSAAQFTPLTKDGKPFELKPGTEYKVKVNMFNPVSHCYNQVYITAGSDSKVVGSSGGSNMIEYPDGLYPTNFYAANHPFFLRIPSFSVQGGSAYACYFLDGTYGKSTTYGTCLHSVIGGTCINSCTTYGYVNAKPYIDKSATFTLDANSYSYNEDTASYSADMTAYNFVKLTAEPEDWAENYASYYVYESWTYKSNSNADFTAGTYYKKVKSADVDCNNYLTLYLGGGDATQYLSSPLYGTAAATDIIDSETEKAIPAYETYQIESIEVYEVGYAAVNFHVGDEVTTVVGEPGDAVELYAPTAPAGQYFVTWYTDADYTTPITDAPTLAEGAPLNLYAKFADYGSYLKHDFESGTHPATAVQYTSVGYSWPLRGYSYKATYAKSDGQNGELVANLTREGLSTDFPESAIAFYGDRTWGQPGGLYLVNPDGTLFVPEAGAQYKVTYRYRAPLNNGNNMAINIAYGIPNALAGLSSSGDKTCYNKQLAYNTISGVVADWTTVTETVTIPAADTTCVPALGLNIASVKKVAVDTDGDDTNDAYNFTLVELDYVEVEKIPAATVNFLNADGSVHTAAATVGVGEEITYPTLTASLNYDYVWSLDADTYVPAPKTLEKEEDLTVYAIQSPVISYENYPVSTDATVKAHLGAIPYDDEMNAVVSSNDAYTGDKSMKLRNYGMHWVVTEAHYATATAKGAYRYDAETDTFVALDEVPEFVAATAETIADGTAFAFKRTSEETGMNVIREFSTSAVTFSYKITFKYKATEKNTTSSTLSARIIPKANIWWGTTDIAGSFTFPEGATDGWQTGEMYVAASEVYAGKESSVIQALDLRFIGNTTLNTNEIYIDDITIEEVQTATFNILADGVTVDGEGTYKDGVFTSYNLTAPVVMTQNGATIKKWYTDEDCTVEATTIVAGGVYYGTIGYVEFVNGENVTKVYYNDGDLIDYPAIAGTKGYDTYWSLKADSYEAVPQNFDGNVTVYAVKDTVIGFNNYVGHAFSSNTNLTITDELEPGNKVLKAQDNDYALLTADKALAEITTGEGEEAVTTTAWLTPGNNYYWATRFMKDEDGNWVKVGDVYNEAPEFEEGKYYSNRNNAIDHAISLWQLEVGKTYKVSFKYYLPETLTKDYRVLPITSQYANIWYSGQQRTYDAYIIGTDAKVGEWVEAEFYFTNAADAEDFSWFYVALYQSDLAVGDVVYFDDFALSEAKVVSFVIEEGMTPEGVVAKDNVITLYFDADEEIVAPVVIDADGNPIEIWLNENGKAVTEFVDGGVYTASVAPAFIYGDCDGDGEVNTTDLAALKLKLAGSGEVGLGGDCDGDGEINTTDLAALKLFLAGSGTLGPQA